LKDLAGRFRDVEIQQAVYGSLLAVLGPNQANLAAALLKEENAMVLEVGRRRMRSGACRVSLLQFGVTRRR
jgi:hypothetical protein